MSRIRLFVESALDSDSLPTLFVGVVIALTWILCALAWVFFFLIGIPILVWFAFDTLVGPVWASIILFLIVCGWIAMIGWIEDESE